MPTHTGGASVITKTISTNPLIAALQNGVSYFAFGNADGTPLTLTYSFAEANSVWHDSIKTLSDGVVPFDEQQKTVIRGALAKWGEVANLNLTEIVETTTSVGDVRIAMSSTYEGWAGSGVGGSAGSPGVEAGNGDLWLNSNYSQYISIGRTSLVLHELGHALGLKHPFQGEPVLSPNMETNQYSVMSYTQSPFFPLSPLAAPKGPMVLDILAIQEIYGANMSTRAGNDLYQYTPSTSAPVIETIWDAGGDDTISAILFSNSVTIDLRPAHFSTIAIDKPLDTLPGGGGSEEVLTQNIGIAYGALIENALGGSGADHLVGNDINNVLTGNDGNDSITGGFGNDTIDGGTGDDSAYFSGTRSQYTVSRADGGFTITGPDGTDKLIRVETAHFDDQPASLTTLAPNTSPSGFVTISGTARQGQTLTALNSLADVDGLGAISYQWKANGVNLAGANASTFKLTQSEVGRTITVVASYTDAFGAAESVDSIATGTVTAFNSTPTGRVTMTGNATQGQTLTAASTLADADGLGAFSYVWKADGQAIIGATLASFTPTESQVGKAITVTASFTDGSGTLETSTSPATLAVANVNDLPIGGVTISGTHTQGKTLTAANTLSDIDGLGTISYQWKSNGTNLAGATANIFSLTEAQVGKTITVTASYTDGHGTVESVISAATNAVANVNDAPTGTVTIIGNTSFGQVLTAANTLADLDGLGTISFQWSADSTAIAGATSSALTLADAQIGKAIAVTASYTDGHGTAESVKSSATSLVTNVPPQTITGTAGNDSSLTGGNGNDAINGLAGLDTAVYTARMAAYTISSTAISGPDGSDTLTSIERLQFLDANLAFDLEGNAGQVYRLYQAAFNRTPDLSGLGGWIAAMDDGMPLLTIASKFMESAEFQSLYGANPTNAQFVANLYTNALHRPSQQDAGSAAGWVDQLSTNAVSRAQALVNFSESAENKASVLPVISGGITYATAAQATGPAKGQSFAGTPNADSLIGTVGNDTFTGGAGNDTIEGGKGLDTAVYGGAKASHTVIRTATGLTVASGSDGTDTLTNVERLKFDDAILAMDTAGNAGQTYRLYQAAFNRTPDKAGLTDWVKGMDTGLTLTQMATAFIGSDEFKGKYGANPTNAEFVDLLYANALHRARAVGDDYWTNQLDSGVTREQALIGFSESAENQASLVGVTQNGIELLVG